MNRDQWYKILGQGMQTGAQSAMQQDALDARAKEADLDRTAQAKLAKDRLAALLRGAQAKPLGSDEQKREILAEEGLQAADRLKQDSAENPRAAKAVAIAEKLSGLPVVGGLAEEGIVGLANLFNPKASDIHADRKTLSGNMGYIKSGSALNKDERLDFKSQLPGATTRNGENLNSQYDRFTAPFRTTKRQVAEKQGKPAPKEAGLSPEQQAEYERLLKELGE